MKKIFILFFTIGVLNSYAQNNATDTSRIPLITPLPETIGNIVSARMDTHGGKLQSADGGIEIIFPENALETETTITVQSTKNILNETDQGAYQLEPSGVQFKKQVQLIFHYTGNNDLADLKNIAWQDDQGAWHRVRETIIDTLQKTISCLTAHFSRWSLFDKISLSPPSATLKVNKSMTLTLISYDDLLDRLSDELTSSASEPDNDDDLLAAPHKVHYYSGEWTVNGQPGGNYDVGWIIRQDNRHAVYKAPALVTNNNPVAVSVQIYSDKKGKKLLLTSNVTIVGDRYRFTYTHYDNSGHFHVHDSSSCIINMEREKVRLSDINNYKPWADGDPGDLCDGAKWTNPDSFKGLVEITGLAGSTIMPPAQEGGLPNVNIVFLPAIGNTPSFSCKQGFGVPSRDLPALPNTLNFDIDHDDVVIHAFGKIGKNQLMIEGKNEKTIIRLYKL